MPCKKEIMQINPITEQPNFKWSKETHLEMTMLALKDCNLANKTKRQIARYSQMPDFCKEELGFHCNTHFYFPNSKSKSFGLNTEKNNALQMFKDHVNAAIFCVKETDFLKQAGYAMHYLQDITVPLHTNSDNLIKQILKYKLHREFERGEKFGANSHLQELKENYKPDDITYTSIVELFKDTALFSNSPQLQPHTSNKSAWKDIQQTCFNRGVTVTTLLFKKLTSLREFFNQDS